MGEGKSENREYRSKDENQQQSDLSGLEIESRNRIQRLEESVKVENKKKF